MKKALLTIAVGITLASSAYANEYLGFNLCAPATIESLKQIVTSKGAAVDNAESADFEEQVKFSELTVIDSKAKGAARLFKDKLMYVQIDYVDGLERALTAKYGSPTVSKRNDGVSYMTDFTFSAKNDSSLAIVVTNTKAPAYRLDTMSVEYRCKPLYSQFMADIAKQEKAEKAEKAAAAKKSGI